MVQKCKIRFLMLPPKLHILHPPLIFCSCIWYSMYISLEVMMLSLLPCHLSFEIAVKLLAKQNTILLGQLIDVLVCVCVCYSACSVPYLRQIHASAKCMRLNFSNVYMMWFCNALTFLFCCEWNLKTKDLLAVRIGFHIIWRKFI